MPNKMGKSPGLERMLIFSDAVIAIAMTLLALDMPVPEANSPAGLFEAFTDEHGREYLAFLIAFALIGASWMAHHTLFSYVADSDDRLMALNLVALFGFVLVPWASEALGTSPGGAGLAVFSAVMTILVGSTPLLAWHVARAGLLEPNVPDTLLPRIWVLAGVPTAMFALSIALAFVIGEFVIILWPLVYIGVAIYARRSARYARGP
jgi:uncharacterized membrane protein